MKGETVEANPSLRSASLLNRALRFASQRAQTCESLSGSLGVSPEEGALYWFSVNSLRCSTGHDLPPLLDATSRCWYAPTWRLSSLLEEFQINEGLASHYERIFYDPEGGHLELNMAANDIVYAIALEHAGVDIPRLRRVCVQACEPTNGIELLAANAGAILLAIEEYREEPFTPEFVEELYGRLMDRIVLRDAGGPQRAGDGIGANDSGSAAAVEVRAEALALLCSFVNGDAGPLAGHAGDHRLIAALVALFFVCGPRPFPAGNAPFAFLLYVLLLHRSGYHFSAHVPVMRLLYGAESEPAAGDRARYAVEGGSVGLEKDPAQLAVECDGTYDWTLAFERAVELIVAEQRWVMTKAEGMSRRRDRMGAIIDADGSMNVRQKEVLLEAMLHSNAEFTYDIHMKRYAISYPSARSDFARLMDLGFLQQSDDGVRHFFFAADDLHERASVYLREHCAEAYLRYYDERGVLRLEFRAADEASKLYNRDIGFYEKGLLDKMYTEHYDFRRASIADADGLVRRSPMRD